MHRDQVGHVGAGPGHHLSSSLWRASAGPFYLPRHLTSNMPLKPPLDDEIGRTYYINDAPWRLVYIRSIRGMALRRLAADLPFEQALERIAAGELHWNPFEHPEPFGRRATLESVQRYVALLGAFRRSPTCINATDWTLLARVDERLADSRTWLARRALTSGDVPGDTTSGSD